MVNLKLYFAIIPPINITRNIAIYLYVYILEFSFLRGLFTGTITMIVCGITGIVAVVYKICKKDYCSAILYALLFATIFFGYVNIM